MKSLVNWIALILVILILYIADIKHMAASQYNTFLILLLVIITGLIMVLKRTYQPDKDE
ncbi:MAG: hypothetical protein V3V39_09805 [Desulfobacterales bacterium]